MNRALRLIGLLIAICPSFLLAQSYTTYTDLDAVKIDYITQQCGEDPNTVTEFNFIRLTNKTDQMITVGFKIEYYYNGVCTTCNTSEYNVSFKVPANAAVTTDCSGISGDNGYLAIIKKYINRNYGHPLDRFELTNITVQ